MQHSKLLWAALLLAMAGCAGHAAVAGPIRVELRPQGGGYRLFRGGKPYFIKGAGGSASLVKLKAAGGNSVRTWGADNLEPVLDEAQRLGMTVTVGIWLGHEEQGFRYSSADQVAQQYATVRRTVQAYKNHPAVLMWGLGNEMEGYGKGDNPAIWKAVNDVAALVKKLDPNHPTMTVVSEIGGDRVQSINRLCPAIDVIGINSYAGGPSIPERYKAAGGARPYVLTEYGPPGTWEVPKTPWGAPVEPSSTAKAAAYRRTYKTAIASRLLCLGGYAFTWGNKQEGTATWFGMLLPDGSRLGAVDAMTELWTGKPPANKCPVITGLTLSGPDQAAPGAVLHATLIASDPDDDPLDARWVVQAERGKAGVGGAREETPPTFPDAVSAHDKNGADVRLPSQPGGYRLFVTLRDNHGGAATANIPLLVKAADSAPPNAG